MQAIILAAGMGTRLKELTKDVPKCMIKVNGKSLIERAVETLAENGISRIVIVSGYKADVLRDFISSRFPPSNALGVKIEFIDNPIFDSSNNIYSLYLAKDVLLSDETLLLESDLIFTPELISTLVKSEGGGEEASAVVSKYEAWMDGTCVTEDESDGRITSFIDKKRFDANRANSYLKTVNIYRFSSEFCRKYYIPFLETVQNTFGKNDYYEQVLGVLTHIKNKIMSAILVPSSWWHEIDTHDDLCQAEAKFHS